MRVKRQLEEVRRLLDKLEAAIVVRDPGNARSAEVFDGLRRTIIQSGKSHRSHIAHLLALQESLDRGAELELIRNRVADFLRELGIEKISNPEFREAFDVVGGSGDGIEMIEPAIVEHMSDGSITIFQQGKVRRFEIPKPTQAIHHESDPSAGESALLHTKTTEEPNIAEQDQPKS